MLISFNDTNHGLTLFKIDSSDDGSLYFHIGLIVWHVGVGLVIVLNTLRFEVLTLAFEIRCIAFKSTDSGFHSLSLVMSNL